MGGNGITTDALFMRIVGVHPNPKIERWKRIPDTDENRSKPNVIEYKGDVLEAFMKESADSAESDDFIRFKQLQIDNSRGGLQDVPSLQRWIETQKGDNRLFLEKGHYGVKNPANRDGPLILENEAQIIMGDEKYYLTPPAIRACDYEILKLLFTERDEQVVLNKFSQLILPPKRIFDQTNVSGRFARPGAYNAANRYGTLVFEGRKFMIKLRGNNERFEMTLWDIICWKRQLGVLKMLLQYFMKGESTGDTSDYLVIRDVMSSACEYNFVQFFNFVGKESMFAWLKKDKKLILYVPVRRNHRQNISYTCIFHPGGDSDKIEIGRETISTSMVISWKIAGVLIRCIRRDTADAFYWIISNCDINPYDTRIWADYMHVIGLKGLQESYRIQSNFEIAVNHFGAKKIRLTANLSIIPKPSLTAVYFNSSSKPFLLKRMSLKESRAPVTLTLRELYKVVEAEDNTSPELVRFTLMKPDREHVLPQWEDFAIEADVHLLSLGVTPGDTIMVGLRLGPPLSPENYDWIYELSDQFKRR